ncbi:hypothetical protein GCM10009430_20570 [Aquimarina litoralis]|uniref:TonB-dependent receptor plug domain-containing protein n=1 Tax=Aquimarina litoralis TaxID=584605 RepID=A0ABN1ISB2_9FLAO
MDNKYVSYYHILFLLFLFGSTGIAQNTSFIKFSDKIEELEKKFDIDFSYNHTTFKNIFLRRNISCDNIQDCIKNIEQRARVTFEKNNSESYIILPIRKNINFQVIDDTSNSTISTLEYQINDHPVDYIFSTNETFTLQNVFLLDSISIHLYSFKSVKLKAEDLLNTPVLKLSKKQFQLDEIVLNSYVTKGIDSKISDHSIQINTQSLGLLAGETDGDIFNVINNIPGIHSPSGKPGNLNFRGNTFDQNLVQIDDIPIYHSGHFLGAISPYNTSVVTDVEIQRNSLPVKWGGRVGGLINMTTYDKIPKENRYEISINSILAGATIKTKLINKKLGLVVSGRSSYPNFNTPKLEAISILSFQGSRLESVADEVNSSSNFDIGFYDINAKLNYDINDQNAITLSFINIQNDLSAQVRNQNEDDEVDFRELELDNWGFTAKWQSQLSKKLKTELRFSKSNFDLNSMSEGFVQNTRSDVERFDNTVLDTRVITEITYDYNDHLSFESGYTLTEHRLTSKEFGQQSNIDSERRQSAIVHSNYISFQKKWNERLIINFGLHNNYYSPLHNLYVNPRFSASYLVNDQLYLKTSFGSSNQFIQKKFTNDFDDFNTTNQLWFLPNDEIRPLKGTQTMIGGIFDSSKWLIDLELYHKKTNDISQKSDDQLGSITSFGTNLFIKKKWRRIEAFINYSLSKTETNFLETSNAFFDQRHIINLTGLVNLEKWKFALSWGYFSGLPVIFPNDSNTGNTATTEFSNRFPGLHQLDFSTSYTFYNTSKSFKTVIGLSILNAYGQDNIVNAFQNQDDNSLRKASRFSPNLQINLFF